MTFTEYAAEGANLLHIYKILQKNITFTPNEYMLF